MYSAYLEPSSISSVLFDFTVFGSLISPDVPFEIFEFDPELVLPAPRQHVDVFVSEPELPGGVAEAVLVLLPVLVEARPRFLVVIASLDHLRFRDYDRSIRHPLWIDATCMWNLPSILQSFSASRRRL